MALLWVEGFEDFTNTNLSTLLLRKYTNTTSGFVVQPSITTGRYGGSALLGGGSSNPQVLWTPSYTQAQTIITGCAFKVPRIASARVILGVYIGTTLQCGVFLETNNTVTFRRNTTTLATSTAKFKNSRWHFIELKVFLSNTVGTYEIRLDGVNILSGTGVDNCNSATEGSDNCALVWDAVINLPDQWLLDDWYVCNSSGSKNNDFLGDNRVVHLVPDGNSAVQFTPSAGQNYAAVDETPANDDTDYVEDSTLGHQDFYTFSDQTGLTTIRGVHVNADAKQSASEKIKLIAKSNGVSDSSAAKTVGTAYSHLNHIVEQNPDGPADWSQTTLNAATFGVEVSA